MGNEVDYVEKFENWELNEEDLKKLPRDTVITYDGLTIAEVFKKWDKEAMAEAIAQARPEEDGHWLEA